MNVSPALETNTEATEVMQPGMRAFNDPAAVAKTAAMFGTAAHMAWTLGRLLNWGASIDRGAEAIVNICCPTELTRR